MNIDTLTVLPESLKSLILNGYVLLQQVKNENSEYYQSYVVFMNKFYILDSAGKCFKILESFDRSELEIIMNITSDKIRYFDGTTITLNLDWDINDINSIKGLAI